MTNLRNRCLAIIPARAGSKRLPGKNLRLLQGIPLVEWSIRRALDTPAISRVAVTSDDPQVLAIAESLRVDAIARPKELASDTATTMDVIQHTLRHYQSMGETFDSILLLQPTSPLRARRDIEDAFSLFAQEGVHAIVSVCPCEHPPQWCGPLPADLNMDHFLDPAVKGKRSQDFPQYYRINGAIYLCRTTVILQQNTLMPAMGTKALVMPAERSIDIDSLLDFQFAQVLADNTETA